MAEEGAADPTTSPKALLKVQNVLSRFTHPRFALQFLRSLAEPS